MYAHWKVTTRGHSSQIYTNYKLFKWFKSGWKEDWGKALTAEHQEQVTTGLRTSSIPTQCLLPSLTMSKPIYSSILCRIQRCTESSLKCPTLVQWLDKLVCPKLTYLNETSWQCQHNFTETPVQSSSGAGLVPAQHNSAPAGTRTEWHWRKGCWSQLQ